jgi:DNA-binding beta-propeller fold protein YncE
MAGLRASRIVGGFAGVALVASALVLQGASSDAATAKLTARSVSLKISGSSVAVGGKVSFTGAVTKSPLGTAVAIQQQSGAKWVTLKTVKTTTKAGAYAWKNVTQAKQGSFVFRASVAKAKTLKAATSATKKLTVTAGATSSSPAPSSSSPAPTPTPTSSSSSPAVAPSVTGLSPSWGDIAGGMTVTVTGTHLTGATAVSFSGSAGTSLNVASDTSLTVITPEHIAGTLDVRVTGAGGTSAAVAGDKYTFKVAPTYDLSFLTGRCASALPPSAVVCLGAPKSVAVDPSGNVYIAHNQDNVVEKVTPQGLSSIFVGTGTAGAPSAGDATSSKLSGPLGLAADGFGNLYIADSGNNRIEKVTPGGTLSIIAGDGTSGMASPGAATSSHLNSPSGVAVDAAGSKVYIADTGNNRVEMVSSSDLTFFAGDGTAGAASAGTATTSHLNNPTGVAVDGNGKVYIADHLNNRVEMVSSNDLTFFAGNGTNGAPTAGTATDSSLSGPTGVAVDAAGSNVYIADTTNHLVEAVSGGNLSILAGKPGFVGVPSGGVAATSSRLGEPTGLTVDGSGNVFIADTLNGVVEKVAAADGTLSIVAGSSLSDPPAVAVDGSGNVYVADKSNHVVEKVTPDGVVSIVAGTGSSGDTVPGGAAGTATLRNLSSPSGVAVDASGNVYIADSSNNIVAKVTPAGALSIVVGTSGVSGTPSAGTASNSKLSSPKGVAVDANGNLYIADSGNNRIEKVTGGQLSFVAGTGVSGTPSAGAATSSNLHSPSGVAVDAWGNVYIADTGNSAVEKVTGGQLSIIAGNGGWDGPTEGLAIASGLADPSGVAVDAWGNVYIADTSNHVVEKVSPAGQLSIIAGNSASSGTPTAGAATSSKLGSIRGVAADADGNVYISDITNGTIEVLTPGW